MSALQYASPLDMQLWAAEQMAREPDFVIGDPASPYMRRWFVVPRNELQNVYLHEILRSDEDSAGHDHPWSNTSIVIEGEYVEVTYFDNQPWIESGRFVRKMGSIVNREATDTHRLIIPEGGRAVSLFITRQKVRDWGFWCTYGRGWVHWREFTGGENGEVLGAGCGDAA